jgi:hypothetical protein
MFGAGISLVDLMGLLNAVKNKDLTLQVKIIDDEWEDISKDVIGKMVKAITSGRITQANDIRLRLFAKT